MSGGRKRGDTVRTAGAWLVTRAADGTVSRAPLHTFDPFRDVRPRAADGTRDPARCAAWTRERLRFARHGAAAVARNHAGGQ